MIQFLFDTLSRENSGKITEEKRYSCASVDSGLPLSIASLNDSGSSLDSVKEADTRTARKLEKSASVDTAAIHSLCSRMEQAVQLSRSYRKSSSAMIEDKSVVCSPEVIMNRTINITLPLTVADTVHSYPHWGYHNNLLQ